MTSITRAGEAAAAPTGGAGGPSTLRLLRGRVHAWTRGRLWLQVLIGLAAGFGLGAALGPEAGLVAPADAEIIGDWLAVPGHIFLGLIAMVLVPLVVISIIQGLTGTEDRRQLREIGGRFVLFVALTTVAAAVLGIMLAQAVRPGDYVTLPSTSTSAETTGSVTASVPKPGVPAMPLPAISPIAAAPAAAPVASPTPAAASQRLEPGAVVRRAPEYIARLIPSDPQRVIQDRDMLAIVILAILIGIACGQANRARIEVFLRYLDGLLELSMVVIKWAMFLAPWAVFGLMAQLVSKVGLSTVFGMGAYVATVVVGLLGLMAVYVLVLLVMRGQGVRDFMRAIGPVQLLAFSTSSSAAVMPISLDTAVKKLGVPEPVAHLVIPLGATVNMAGTALYQSVAVVFLAQMSGVALSPVQLALIVLVLTASSIGAPGTPGVGIVILANVVAGFGIPTAGLVLILGVDRLLDMCRTVVNVTGDLTAAVLLSPERHARVATERAAAAVAAEAKAEAKAEEMVEREAAERATPA